MVQAGTGLADAPRNPGVTDDDTQPRRKRKGRARGGANRSCGGGSNVGGDGGKHGGVSDSGDGALDEPESPTPLGSGVADSTRRLGRYPV